MPNWTIDYLEDGVAPGAAGVNALFDDAKTIIDAIGSENMRRGAFNRYKGADVVVGMATGSGYQVEATDGVHEYTHMAPFTDLNYDDVTDFVEAPSGVWVSIGNPAQTGAYTGDEFVIEFDDQFRLDGSYSTGDVHRVGAVEIGLNIEVHDAVDGGGALATGEVLFCIQYMTVEGGVWRTVLRSIRSFSLEDRVMTTETIDNDSDFDAAIRILLTKEDFPSETNQLQAVRACVALHAVGGLVGGDTIRLREGNFSAIPTRCLATNQ